MPHKHAERMMEYAQDAMETETPWERWECREDGTNQQWAGFFGHNPCWSTDYEYRRKPKTITVNGIELPAPCRGAMKVGQKYYTTTTPAGVSCWNDDSIDRHRMESGQVHLTKEAANQWSQALKKITS